MRSGFSLVEALVALVLFQIGMLALAAAAAVAARDMGSAARRVHAVALAHNAAERMRIGVCAAPAGGGERALPGGYREFWRVDVVGRRRVVTDSVVYVRKAGKPAQVTARMAVLCAA